MPVVFVTYQLPDCLAQDLINLFEREIPMLSNVRTLCSRWQMSTVFRNRDLLLIKFKGVIIDMTIQLSTCKQIRQSLQFLSKNQHIV